MRLPGIAQYRDYRQAKQDRFVAETALVRERAAAYSERAASYREMKENASKATAALIAQVEKPMMTLNEELYGGSTGYTNNTWGQNHSAVRRFARIAHSQSPAAQAMIDRFVHMVYGPKLELQAAPFFDLINKSNPTNKAPIDIESQQDVIKNIEQRYRLWARSSKSDYTGNKYHYKRSRDLFGKLLLDGEYFVVLRYKQTKKRNPLTIQFIKPENVQRVESLVLGSNYEESGIEYNLHDEAVAYHILNSKTGKSVRIPRYGTRSHRTMIIHNKINGEKRGVSILSGIISELTKLSDLQALEIQACVINALFAVWVETPVGGENKNFVDKKGISGIGNTLTNRSRDGDLSVAEYEAKLNSTDFNQGGIVAQGMGEGQKLHSFDTKRPTANFKEFFEAVKRNLYAAKGMSLAVADYQFDGSYSAARGELLVFWNNILTLRFDHATGYESVIYQMWLWGEIDNGNVPDYGYSDEFIRESMSYALFTGPTRPDIDPEKSGKAHLMETHGAWKTGAMVAAERGGGDFDENVKRLTIENIALAEANRPVVEQDKTTFSNSKTETKSESISKT